jgi:hypothetical protein
MASNWIYNHAIIYVYELCQYLFQPIKERHFVSESISINDVIWVMHEHETSLIQDDLVMILHSYKCLFLDHWFRLVTEHALWSIKNISETTLYAASLHKTILVPLLHDPILYSLDSIQLYLQQILQSLTDLIFSQSNKLRLCQQVDHFIHCFNVTEIRS